MSNGHQPLPRDGVRQPFEGYPAYGAVHDVIPNSQLRGFLYGLADIADDVFYPERHEIEINPIPDYNPAEEFDPISLDPSDEAAEKVYDPRAYYRIFDVETMGVSVVEMDPSAKQARSVRTVWEKQDFGAVEQDAKNQILRRLPNTVPHLFFNRVEGVGRRLPGVSKNEVRRKIALMPDTTRFNETLDIIQEEADIVTSAIRKRLKQFTYPWDITPHLTIAVFRSKAEPEQINQIVTEANEVLSKEPFGVALDHVLNFRYKTSRSDRT